MLSEADIRLEIDEALRNKGWKLSGKDKNVLTEKSSSAGRADYALKPNDREHPLIIIEAKRRGKDLNEALKQALKYAEQFNSPIAYASDGSTIKTIHRKTLKPLVLDGEEVDEFISEDLALKFLHTNEYNTIDKQIIKSRKELINIFASANKELRKEGMQAGVERFSEFCNILFLKIFSEEEDRRREQNLEPRIRKDFNWNKFKDKNGDELLSYVNDTVLKHFQEEYGTDIFSPLQIKNPLILKKIIDSLDSLSLVDTNSDIKGDAFEYFLKAYLAKQNKDLGEYFTPRHIVKTLVKLVNPKFGETVYDPFCGTGGMLIEAFKHIYNKMPRNERTLQQLRRETIYGSEITKNARITKMNMILTGDGHNNILRQDSLKNPTQMKYDVVITNMPFSLGSYDEYSGLYKLGSSNGNSLCIEHCFDAIDSNSENPRMGIIVPEGILFDKNFKKLREYIYKNSYVKDIVSLPSGAFKPYTDVKTSILYLTKINKNSKAQQSVWHYTVKNDGYTLNTKRQKKDGENDLDLFLSFYDTDDENNLLNLGFNKLSMEEIRNNNYISIPNPYKKFEFNSKFETVELKEFIEEIIVCNDIEAPVWSVTNKNGGSFIPQNEVFREKVASENTENYKLVKYNHFAYSPPRINVGSIALNLSKQIGCISPIYIVFKVKDEAKLNPKYLYKLFQSQQFKDQINSFAFGSVRQTVNFDDFCKITIPLPNIDEQQRIVEELESYYQIVKNTTASIDHWKPYIEIEKEYKIVKLNEICKKITDGSHNPPIALTEGKPMLSAVNIANFEVIFDPNKIRYISEEDFEQENKRTNISTGDVLLSIVGTIGKTAIVQENCPKFTLQRSVAVIKCDDKFIHNHYLMYFFCSKQAQHYFINKSKTTTQSGIYLKELKEMPISLPPLDIQKQMVDELETERNMITFQREIIHIFQNKIISKLDSIWQFKKTNETKVNQLVFDMLK